MSRRHEWLSECPAIAAWEGESDGANIGCEDAAAELAFRLLGVAFDVETSGPGLAVGAEGAANGTAGGAAAGADDGRRGAVTEGARGGAATDGADAGAAGRGGVTEGTGGGTATARAAGEVRTVLGFFIGAAKIGTTGEEADNCFNDDDIAGAFLSPFSD